MKLALNTFAALALSASTAFAAGVDGPSMDNGAGAANATTGQAVTIQVSDFNSKRSGSETMDGNLQVTLFEGSDTVDSTPGGSHFR